MNLPTQIRFLIGGMRGTFRWSTQKFPGASRPHLGNNDLNFRLARVQLVPLETAANLYTSRRLDCKGMVYNFRQNSML